MPGQRGPRVARLDSRGRAHLLARARGHQARDVRLGRCPPMRAATSAECSTMSLATGLPPVA